MYKPNNFFETNPETEPKLVKFVNFKKKLMSRQKFCFKNSKKQEQTTKPSKLSEAQQIQYQK